MGTEIDRPTRRSALPVFLLLWAFFTPLAACIRAGFFAIHPVHVEAIANVMGRSELYAALGQPEKVFGARRAALLLSRG